MWYSSMVEDCSVKKKSMVQLYGEGLFSIERFSIAFMVDDCSVEDGAVWLYGRGSFSGEWNSIALWWKIDQ